MRVKGGSWMEAIAKLKLPGEQRKSTNLPAVKRYDIRITIASDVTKNISNMSMTLTEDITKYVMEGMLGNGRKKRK